MTIKVLLLDSAPRRRGRPQFNGVGGHVEVLDAVPQGDDDASTDEEDEPRLFGAVSAPIRKKALQIRFGVRSQFLYERRPVFDLSGHLVVYRVRVEFMVHFGGNT